jgi:hypothetical protein
MYTKWKKLFDYYRSSLKKRYCLEAFIVFSCVLVVSLFFAEGKYDIPAGIADPYIFLHQNYYFGRHQQVGIYILPIKYIVCPIPKKGVRGFSYYGCKNS